MRSQSSGRLGHHGQVTDAPAWWRGEVRPEAPQGYIGPEGVITGDVSAIKHPPADPRTGLASLYFFRAVLRNTELWLNDVHLTVEWSEFHGCHFRQRVRPVLNELGFAAQGSFGSGPAVYRHCTFERVRFKGLGGFSMDRGRFEDCAFVNCRWEGHFAGEADLINNRFIGRMNGCVWFGHSAAGRRNIIEGNDFSQTDFTSNVGWRFDFPRSDQRWPTGYAPQADG